MSWSFTSKAQTGREVQGHDDVNKDDDPAGGYAYEGYFDVGTGEIPRFMVRWQDGPLDRAARDKPNGAFVEDLLEVCRRRLAFYQKSRFSCEENARAIEHLEVAMTELAKRRVRRVAEGKQTPPSAPAL